MYAAHLEPPPQKAPFRSGLPGRHLSLSVGHEDHERLLHQLFETLRQAKLQINWGKGHVGLSEVLFAGFPVKSEGFRPPLPKARAIIKFPKPTDLSQLRHFIGMINYYRRCILHTAQCQAPLFELLKW